MLYIKCKMFQNIFYALFIAFVKCPAIILDKVNFPGGFLLLLALSVSCAKYFIFIVLRYFDFERRDHLSKRLLENNFAKTSRFFYASHGFPLLTRILVKSLWSYQYDTISIQFVLRYDRKNWRHRELKWGVVYVLFYNIDAIFFLCKNIFFIDDLLIISSH